ncbi:MAG TPA: hypothetical protein DIT13_09620 [Verrucomicrobiales bacterium]|nr:hypothetical protein [Verrucomicrobiales bacterium]
MFRAASIQPRASHPSLTAGVWRCLPWAALALAMPLASARERTYFCLVHDPRSPVEYYANATGGGRGLFGGTDEVAVTRAGEAAWRVSVRATKGEWAYGGFINAVTRAVEDQVMVNPNALWHPMILKEFQPRLKSIRVELAGARSPAGRADLHLRLELKGWDKNGAQVPAQAFAADRATLLNGPHPKKLSFPVDAMTGPAGAMIVMLDNAAAGDEAEIGAIEWEVALGETPLPRRAALLGLGALLANWDSSSGMAQDRGSFPAGIYENLTATAKLAKIIALAAREGIVDETAGKAAIEKIAATLLDVVPRGPQPSNRLWPHFTRNGGTARHEGSEWSSGDTAYAVADLALALALTGDAQKRLPQLMEMLRGINWRMLHDRGFYRHGYDRDGKIIPHRWQGFGVETLGVNLAALAGGGPPAEMLPPPTDDGSGFNMHAAYPLPFAAVDCHGNDWRRLRLEEIRAQTGWHRQTARANTRLADAHLFGLSAAETPDGQNYMAYGIGGRLDGARDGGGRIVTPHYCGMVAALAPEDAARMVESLEARGWLTPLNSADSVEIDPVTGRETVNWMKGSWNLALFTEGWLFANPDILSAANEALRSIPEFARAWDLCFPPR